MYNAKTTDQKIIYRDRRQIKTSKTDPKRMGGFFEQIEDDNTNERYRLANENNNERISNTNVRVCANADGIVLRDFMSKESTVLSNSYRNFKIYEKQNSGVKPTVTNSSNCQKTTRTIDDVHNYIDEGSPLIDSWISKQLEENRQLRVHERQLNADSHKPVDNLNNNDTIRHLKATKGVVNNAAKYQGRLCRTPSFRTQGVPRTTKDSNVTIPEEKVYYICSLPLNESHFSSIDSGISSLGRSTERVFQNNVTRNRSFTQRNENVFTSNTSKSAKRLTQIISELCRTERSYVANLDKLLNKFIPHLICNTPHQYNYLHDQLFRILSHIFKKQKRFLEALVSCLNNAEYIARTFIEFEHLFDLYPIYFGSQPTRQCDLNLLRSTIKYIQDHIMPGFDFFSYLVTPLQRLGNYIMFLESMEKEVKKTNAPCENVQEALCILRNVMTRGNDFVATECIQKSPIKKEYYGNFRMSNLFIIERVKKMESMVFLFTNIVVFTVVDQRGIELYNYHDSIPLKDLSMSVFPNGTFHLINYPKSKRKDVTKDEYTFSLETRDEAVRRSWIANLHELLWQQMATAKEEQKCSLAKSRARDRNQ